jgi:hypothetical protein
MHLSNLTLFVIRAAATAALYGAHDRVCHLLETQ